MWLSLSVMTRSARRAPSSPESPNIRLLGPSRPHSHRRADHPLRSACAGQLYRGLPAHSAPEAAVVISRICAPELAARDRRCLEARMAALGDLSAGRIPSAPLVGWPGGDCALRCPTRIDRWRRPNRARDGRGRFSLVRRSLAGRGRCTKSRRSTVGRRPGRSQKPD